MPFIPYLRYSNSDENQFKAHQNIREDVCMITATHTSDNVLKILEENHYYPFELKHNGYNSNQLMIRGIVTDPSAPVVVIVPVISSTDLTYKYKFNGKEFQDEFGLVTYDFGKRSYSRQGIK